VLLSVLVRAYDRKTFLLQGLRSLVDQTLSRDKYEVIVVKNFSDREIDAFIEENGMIDLKTDEIGLGSSLYSGLKRSSGDVISFLDDDDLFLPWKLERVYELFSSSALGYYHNSVKIIGERTDVKDVNVQRGERKPFPLIRITASDMEGGIRRDLLESPMWFNNSSITVRRELIERFAEQFKSIRILTDLFFLHISHLYGAEMVFDPEILTLYRRHGNNVTSPNTSDLDGWAHGQVRFLGSSLADLKLMYDMTAENDPIRDFLRLQILDKTLLLSRFPKRYAGTEYRAGVREVLRYIAENGRDLSTVVSALAALSPDFVKMILLRRWYRGVLLDSGTRS